MRKSIIILVFILVFGSVANGGERQTFKGTYKIPDLGECVVYSHIGEIFCVLGEFIHPLTGTILQLVDVTGDWKYDFVFAWQWMVTSEGKDLGWMAYGKFIVSYQESLDIIYGICADINTKFPSEVIKYGDCIEFSPKGKK